MTLRSYRFTSYNRIPLLSCVANGIHVAKAVSIEPTGQGQKLGVTMGVSLSGLMSDPQTLD